MSIMRIVILTIIALIVTTAPAQAGTYFRNQDGTSAGKYNRWMRLAKVAAPDALVTIREHTTPDDLARVCGDLGSTGCVYPAADGRSYDMELLVQTDAREQRLTFWHEMGHVFDFAMFNDAQRDRFMTIIGNREGVWDTAEYDTTPNEVFARTYAACGVLGPQLRKGQRAYAEWSGVVATNIGRHARTCKLIERASIGTGLIDLAPKR